MKQCSGVIHMLVPVINETKWKSNLDVLKNVKDCHTNSFKLFFISTMWHLVQLHLLTQASQPRTCLQHVDIINAGYVNPWHIIQRNTSFNGITSWNVLEMFPSGMIILSCRSTFISWISSLSTLFVIAMCS